LIYDQVVVAHATDITSGAEPGPAGAVGLTSTAGIFMRPVVRDGKVVALESIDPPGAVNVKGAAMWSGAWIKRIPETLRMTDPSDPSTEVFARQLYADALANQAKGGPRDSPLPPLVHHTVDQISAANQ
jgi:hypothetical protein